MNLPNNVVDKLKAVDFNNIPSGDNFAECNKNVENTVKDTLTTMEQNLQSPRENLKTNKEIEWKQNLKHKLTEYYDSEAYKLAYQNMVDAKNDNFEQAKQAFYMGVAAHFANHKQEKVEFMFENVEKVYNDWVEEYQGTVTDKSVTGTTGCVEDHLLEFLDLYTPAVETPAAETVNEPQEKQEMAEAPVEPQAEPEMAEVPAETVAEPEMGMAGMTNETIA